MSTIFQTPDCHIHIYSFFMLPDVDQLLEGCVMKPVLVLLDVVVVAKVPLLDRLLAKVGVEPVPGIGVCL